MVYLVITSALHAEGPRFIPGRKQDIYCCWLLSTERESILFLSRQNNPPHGRPWRHRSGPNVLQPSSVLRRKYNFFLNFGCLGLGSGNSSKPLYLRWLTMVSSWPSSSLRFCPASPTKWSALLQRPRTCRSHCAGVGRAALARRQGCLQTRLFFRAVKS